MKLSDILAALLAQTPLKVRLKDDREVDRPSDLMDIALHHQIGDALFDAGRDAGLSPKSAAAFGEWVAEIVTGFATRYANEQDILRLDDVFAQAAYGDRKSVVRLCLAPSFDALSEHLPNIQRGVRACFEAVRRL
ncbi:MAG: hypothetical protein SLRJCFUN_001578 [Candidatus Fervidibacter sp.]|jgi:hypothetical protein